MKYALHRMENPTRERLGMYRVVVDRQGIASAYVSFNMQNRNLVNGAGTRNRTEDTSLEGWGFTPKLCPRPKSSINLSP